MTAGGTPQLTDEIPVARAGTNRKLTISDIVTFVNANGRERKGATDSSGALPT